MKLAESIRYGGQLIDASDCDYESYKKLGLLCPECKNPIFLRAKHERVVKNKIALVEPSFCHFKAVDAAQVLRCENRVKNYNAKDIQKRAVSARNQRLKLLQRWFWTIFINSNSGLLATAQTLNEPEGRFFIEEDPLGIIAATLEAIYGIPDYELVEWFKQGIQKHLLEYLERQELLKSQNTKDRLEYLLATDKEFHALICAEVLLFLRSKSSRELFRKVVYCSYLVFFLSPTAKKQMNLLEMKETAVFGNLLTIIMFIPWFDEFQRLQN